MQSRFGAQEHQDYRLAQAMQASFDLEVGSLFFGQGNPAAAAAATSSALISPAQHPAFGFGGVSSPLLFSPDQSSRRFSFANPPFAQNGYQAAGSMFSPAPFLFTPREFPQSFNFQPTLLEQSSAGFPGQLNDFEMRAYSQLRNRNALDLLEQSEEELESDASPARSQGSEEHYQYPSRPCGVFSSAAGEPSSSLGLGLPGSLTPSGMGSSVPSSLFASIPSPLKDPTKDQFMGTEHQTLSEDDYANTGAASPGGGVSDKKEQSPGKLLGPSSGKKRRRAAEKEADASASALEEAKEDRRVQKMSKNGPKKTLDYPGPTENKQTYHKQLAQEILERIQQSQPHQILPSVGVSLSSGAASASLTTASSPSGLDVFGLAPQPQFYFKHDHPETLSFTQEFLSQVVSSQETLKILDNGLINKEQALKLQRGGDAGIQAVLGRITETIQLIEVFRKRIIADIEKLRDANLTREEMTEQLLLSFQNNRNELLASLTLFDGAEDERLAAYRFNEAVSSFLNKLRPDDSELTGKLLNENKPHSKKSINSVVIPAINSLFKTFVAKGKKDSLPSLADSINSNSQKIAPTCIGFATASGVASSGDVVNLRFVVVSSANSDPARVAHLQQIIATNPHFADVIIPRESSSEFKQLLAQVTAAAHAKVDQLPPAGYDPHRGCVEKSITSLMHKLQAALRQKERELAKPGSISPQLQMTGMVCLSFYPYPLNYADGCQAKVTPIQNSKKIIASAQSQFGLQQQLQQLNHQEQQLQQALSQEGLQILSLQKSLPAQQQLMHIQSERHALETMLQQQQLQNADKYILTLSNAGEAYVFEVKPACDHCQHNKLGTRQTAIHYQTREVPLFHSPFNTPERDAYARYDKQPTTPNALETFQEEAVSQSEQEVLQYQYHTAVLSALETVTSAAQSVAASQANPAPSLSRNSSGRSGTSETSDHEMFELRANMERQRVDDMESYNGRLQLEEAEASVLDSSASAMPASQSAHAAAPTPSVLATHSLQCRPLYQGLGMFESRANARSMSPTQVTQGVSSSPHGLSMELEGGISAGAPAL